MHQNTEDFTLELYFYYTSTLPSTSASWCLFTTGAGSADRGLTILLDTRGLIFRVARGVSGSYSLDTTFPVIPTINTWNHISISKTSGFYYLSLNGNVNSIVKPSNQSATTSSLISHVGSYATQLYCNGYIDSLRITQGIARYTANFDPETDTYLAY